MRIEPTSAPQRVYTCNDDDFNMYGRSRGYNREGKNRQLRDIFLIERKMNVQSRKLMQVYAPG